MKSIYLFLMVLFFTLSCKERASSGAETVTTEMDMAASAAPEAAPKGDQVKFVALKKTNEFDEQIPLKIIKNGNLSFETDDLDATYKNVIAAVNKTKAFVQNDTEGKDQGAVYRSITLRVPRENFDLLIKQISEGVSYFDTKEITSEDVTEEYVDVEARVKAKKALENRYMELLKNAHKVAEMIEIEKQLSEIREEIESKEARLKYIDQRVAMSTITIYFYRTIANKGDATVSFGRKFVNALQTGFNGISSFFIWMIEIWPFILILVTIFYFVRRKLKKKNNP